MTSLQCSRCGAVIQKLTELVRVGDGGAPVATIGHISACDACIEETEREITHLRRRFDMLLENGVSRERANDIMCSYIEKLHDHRAASSPNVETPVIKLSTPSASPRRGRMSTRERLVKRLADAGFEVISITPTRGYWLHATQDCWRWEGYAMHEGQRAHLFSWWTMRECARKPIHVHRDDKNNYEVTTISKRSDS